MIGAIVGDIIGSRFEHHNYKKTNFELFDRWCRFTDDTVLTVATADALLHGYDYAEAYKKWHDYYPRKGYGPSFLQWIGRWNLTSAKPPPYSSFGNGSAMRVSPIGWVFDSLEDTLSEAKRSAEVTHNHPEGIKGAQAVAGIIFLARTGVDKQELRKFVSDRFGYNLNRTLDEIRPTYKFDMTCQGSVPESIIAFLESSSFEDAIRKAVSIGGDSDTIACITGSLSSAYYWHIPPAILNEAYVFLDERIMQSIRDFIHKHGLYRGKGIMHETEIEGFHICKTRRREMTSISYRGYEIRSAPMQLADTGEWSIELYISKDNGNGITERKFSAENTFKTRAEAIKNCVNAK